MHDYPLTVLQDIIIPAARTELLPRFAAVTRRHKADGSILTEADLALQARVAGRLRERWPDTLFLGEEMTPAEQQALIASSQPVWCLDPLDGTSNFATGIPYFCVSLALLHAGAVRLGLVYDPVRDECFTATAAQGARLNGESLVVATAGLALRQGTALVDFKRLDKALAARLVTDIPYASQRSFGSVALDWCWLAAMSTCTVAPKCGIMRPDNSSLPPPVVMPAHCRANRCLPRRWRRVPRSRRSTGRCSRPGRPGWACRACDSRTGGRSALIGPVMPFHPVCITQ